MKNERLRIDLFSLTARLKFIFLFAGIFLPKFLQAQQYPEPEKSIVVKLLNQDRISIDEAMQLGFIDPYYIDPLSETVGCDTTIQVNNDIFYSVILLQKTHEQNFFCLHAFMVTMNSQKIIDSRYLCSACDVDYSQNVYDWYEQEIAPTGRVIVRQTTVFQSRNNKSGVEEKTVKETQYFVDDSGQILVGGIAKY